MSTSSFNLFFTLQIRWNITDDIFLPGAGQGGLIIREKRIKLSLRKRTFFIFSSEFQLLNKANFTSL